jgi:hypothetical protein
MVVYPVFEGLQSYLVAVFSSLETAEAFVEANQSTYTRWGHPSTLYVGEARTVDELAGVIV